MTYYEIIEGDDLVVFPYELDFRFEVPEEVEAFELI